ncbi:uncharacterized protein PAC_14681 [Phialocephala subalpina]|uniref:Uncharacterized protein n=1 Tax=Phialocephala subalpina TaxID=576137 RepID=A0A1L7XIC0_9HELO|nr:uncharacterized protein PAC_14681 [Phialocephala subalpina]
MLFSKLIMTVSLMAAGLAVAMPAADGVNVAVRDDEAPTGSFSFVSQTGTRTRGPRPTGTGGAQPTGTRGPRLTGTGGARPSGSGRPSGTRSRRPRPTGTFTLSSSATETPSV